MDPQCSRIANTDPVAGDSIFAIANNCWRIPTTRSFKQHHRSLVQIKSHAQKVLKRLESGENVFRRLEENYGIVDTLIVQAAKQRDSMALPADSKSLAAKRKLQANKTERIESEYPSTTTQLLPPNPENPSEGRGAVIAAAALCQLSSFGTTTTWEQQQPQQA